MLAHCSAPQICVLKKKKKKGRVHAEAMIAVSFSMTYD